MWEVHTWAEKRGRHQPPKLDHHLQKQKVQKQHHGRKMASTSFLAHHLYKLLVLPGRTVLTMSCVPRKFYLLCHVYPHHHLLLSPHVFFLSRAICLRPSLSNHFFQWGNAIFCSLWPLVLSTSITHPFLLCFLPLKWFALQLFLTTWTQPFKALFVLRVVWFLPFLMTLIPLTQFQFCAQFLFISLDLIDECKIASWKLSSTGFHNPQGCFHGGTRRPPAHIGHSDFPPLLSILKIWCVLSPTWLV